MINKDKCKKCGTELEFLAGRPARSSSMYCPNFPDCDDCYDYAFDALESGAYTTAEVSKENSEIDVCVSVTIKLLNMDTIEISLNDAEELYSKLGKALNK